MTKTKNFLVALLGVAAMLAVPAAMAQKGRSTASPWYVGLHLGQSDIKEAGDEDTAFRILGGYQFHPNLAAELAYTDFGSVGVAGTNVEGNAIELVAVGSWPVADRFSVYGKLGFARGELEAGGLSDDSI